MKTQDSALLAVLWMTVILTFVGIALASTVRSEVESTRVMAEGEQGYFLARAGIDAALYHLAYPNEAERKQSDDPAPRVLNYQFDTGTARVEYRPASAQFNVNDAPVAMLRALFEQLGAATDVADTLARQVELLRKPPSPLQPHSIESLEELLQLPAMTKTLYYGGFSGGRLRPPLDEVLGTAGSSDSINVNYAQPELLAVLPEIGEGRAADWIAARPIRKLEAGPHTVHLNLSDAPRFTLIAHGRTAGSDVERVIRASYARTFYNTLQQQAPRPLGVRLLEWNDRP